MKCPHYPNCNATENVIIRLTMSLIAKRKRKISPEVMAEKQRKMQEGRKQAKSLRESRQVDDK